MKKIWVYLLGVLSGIILISLLSEIIVTDKSNSNPAYMSGLTLFEEPGDVMDDGGYRVEEVLKNGTAIARSNGSTKKVLLWKQDGKYYYDKQKITLNEGKCFRQIGIYKFGSRETVPVVTIMDK